MIKFLDCTKMGYYSRNNPSRGGEGGEGEDRTWNFQGYWRNTMWKFKGSIKKEVEFLGVLKKYSCGVPMGLGFWPYNFQGVLHKFAEFSWWQWYSWPILENSPWNKAKCRYFVFLYFISQWIGNLKIVVIEYNLNCKNNIAEKLIISKKTYLYWNY